MSRFAWEPPTRLKLGDQPPLPKTAADLLRDLGVENAPQSMQREAVNTWLLENPADKLLGVSLRKRGLPAAPIDVTPPSGVHVQVVPTTATIVSASPWYETNLILFPRAARFDVPRTFVPTAIVNHVVAATREPSPEEQQPDRRRDGTPVA
jgi:hypothetical protein